MKLREGKAKMPILPRKVQIAFASLTGAALVTLVVFLIVNPTEAELTVANTDTTPALTIDGATEGLSTVERKKPLEIDSKVQDSLSVDGETSEDAAKREAAAAETKAAADAAAQKEAMEEKAAADKKAIKEDAPKKQASKDLTFVARPGDSYTVIARAAVAHYATSQNLTLSPAQKVAAETFLTQAAAAPQLDIAQEVTVSVDAIKSAVNQALDLSDEDLAAWDVFASQVDWDDDDSPEPAADDAGVGSGAIDGGAAGSADGAGSADSGAGSDSGGR